MITTSEALAQLAGRLGAAPRVAVDTEAASFHRYIDRVYLIQVSSDKETALIDPLAVDNLEPFGAVLADAKVEKVLHDADYDLRILDRDYGFRARHLFDTRVVAQLLGEPGIGLAALLEKYLDTKLDKKYQRADWSMRPLTPEMIAYAAADTHYLLALRDRLERELVDRTRLAWAEEEFGLLEGIRWSGAAPDGEAYLRLKGVKTLPPRAQAVARAVYEWREATARGLDRATFRVLGNEEIVALARSQPADLAALEQVPRFPRSIAKRYGPDLVDVVAGAMALPADQLPQRERRQRTPHDPQVDVRLARLKEHRNQRAVALGLEPGVLCPNGTLLDIARAAPKTPADLAAVESLRGWQREALDVEAVLAAVAG